jgi:hypothetical protein
VRRLGALGVALVAFVSIGAIAGCSGSSGSDSSGSKGAGTTTTTVPKQESAWTKQWKPVLTNTYGPAQQAFLTAIQGGLVADVQSAGQKVVDANTALTTAITNAGPPPAADAAASARLVKGLGTELLLVKEVLRTCTSSSQECQAAVTAYGENNQKQIVPGFTGLGAMR